LYLGAASGDEGNKPDELEGMYILRVVSKAMQRLGIQRRSYCARQIQETVEFWQWFKEGQEAKVQFRGHGQDLLALFRRSEGLCQCDYSLQAIMKIGWSKGKKI
jgi:hypothetical protein